VSEKAMDGDSREQTEEKISLPPRGVWSMQWAWACLSACISRKPHGQTLPNFCACWLWRRLSPLLAVLWCYVLPVLWMTSCLHKIWHVMCTLITQQWYYHHSTWGYYRTLMKVS